MNTVMNLRPTFGALLLSGSVLLGACSVGSLESKLAASKSTRSSADSSSTEDDHPTSGLLMVSQPNIPASPTDVTPDTLTISITGPTGSSLDKSVPYQPGSNVTIANLALGQSQVKVQLSAKGTELFEGEADVVVTADTPVEADVTLKAVSGSVIVKIAIPNPETSPICPAKPVCKVAPAGYEYLSEFDAQGCQVGCGDLFPKASPQCSQVITNCVEAPIGYHFAPKYDANGCAIGCGDLTKN